ncbi:MAG: PDZ domain-containing protein [Oligoflexia bacterium]|nr:PDZ domain-containing protein [Oligoflexia bacterium]
MNFKLYPLFSILFFSLLSSNSYALFGGSNNNEKRALLESEKNTINIFKENVKSVVNVSNIKNIRRGGFFSGYEEMEVPSGQGSGFVWDNDGHIVTNFHVVQGGDSFLISFHKDSKQYKAKFVGGEPKKDIAVLKLIEKPKNLIPLKVGSSKDLQVGQKALAIGNPFGLDHTITSGIISALGRRIKGYAGVTIQGMIQTDCSINPGNSGGPLLDSQGQLIGVNTMIFSASGSSAGVGFAVPVGTVKSIVPQLIKNGKVTRPGLGIGLLEDHVKLYFGIEEGIVIKTVLDDGPAKKAGLKGMGRDRSGRYIFGDIILKVAGKKVNTFDDIYQVLEDFKVGDRVEIEYLRDGKTQKVKLNLGAL